jgi:endonuclease/exonuclease/phosphatase family metal-dependent hydrolase
VKLRVATYNIHKGVTVRGRPRIHDVRKALQAMNADIVFLQEVQDRNERLAARHATYPKSTQIEFLAAQIYEHHAYGMNAVYPHGHHGNAILSRHTIRQFTNHDVSDHALEKRGLLHAVCRVGKRDVHLICVHFGLFKRSRLRQASFLIDFVESELPEKAPLIIGGDFNDWQRRVDKELRRRLGVIEASDASAEPTLLDRLLPWRGTARTGGGKSRLARTYPALLPWLHLDRIYLRGFRVTSVEVPRGPAWAKRSDHVPLIAEVQFK